MSTDPHSSASKSAEHDTVSFEPRDISISSCALVVWCTLPSPFDFPRSLRLFSKVQQQICQGRELRSPWSGN